MAAETMLYMNGSTHEESLLQVVPSGREHRAAVVGYSAAGEFEKVLVGVRFLNMYYKENIVLEGRAGLAMIISDEQAASLRAETKRLRDEFAAHQPLPSRIAAGERCHSCGAPRYGNGECKRCGDDTRAA